MYKIKRTNINTVQAKKCRSRRLKLRFRIVKKIKPSNSIEWKSLVSSIITNITDTKKNDKRKLNGIHKLPTVATKITNTKIRFCYDGFSNRMNRAILKSNCFHFASLGKYPSIFNKSSAIFTSSISTIISTGAVAR